MGGKTLRRWKDLMNKYICSFGLLCLESTRLTVRGICKGKPFPFKAITQRTIYTVNYGKGINFYVIFIINELAGIFRT